MQIEIPDETGKAVEDLARETVQDVASLAAEMLTEAIKMRRVPGIVFVDEGSSPARRACVPGTRIPVWEIAEYYEFVGRDREELHRGFDWLSGYQLDMALDYYAAFPDDILPHIKTEEEALADLHRLWEEIPQTSPHWPGRFRSAVSPASAESA
jgi:uncharacterized protein (DUF433 family)